jgi:hypothetical protein
VQSFAQVARDYIAIPRVFWGAGLSLDAAPNLFARAATGYLREIAPGRRGRHIKCPADLLKGHIALAFHQCDERAVSFQPLHAYCAASARIRSIASSATRP